MDKLRIAAATVLLVIITAGAALGAGLLRPDKSLAISEAPLLTVAAAEADIPISEPVTYTVREVDGIVYAFGSDGSTQTIHDITPAHLREADARSLHDGIDVADDEGLARLIEDLGS